MKKTTKELINKIIAVIAIIVGLHLFVAYFQKVLPFGLDIPYNPDTRDFSTILWVVWGYCGWMASFGCLGYGIYKLGKKFID